MSLVVIGTGTGVGKTVASSVLLARYGRSLRLGYWKPIQTGAAEERDSRFVKRCCGHLVDVLDEVYLFDPPLSPHLAARLAGVRIEPERILGALVAHAGEDPERSLVIEGAGGLLVPLTDQGYLLADLLRDLHLPSLLVARSELGTINHTLLTLEALRSRGIEFAGVVLAGPKNPENRAAIERFGKAEVIAEIPQIRPVTRAGIVRAADGFDEMDGLRQYLM